MRKIWRAADRAAGRVYTGILAIVSGSISVAMLAAAAISWRLSGPLGGLVWLIGALVFFLLARASWRSAAALSDIDFTG